MFAARHGVAGDDWDAALLAMRGHFLQSTPWQRVQQALGHEVITCAGEHSMWAGAVRAGRFPRYMYVPYGPTMQDGGAEALSTLRAAARQGSLDFVRVEPAGDGTLDVLRRDDAVRTRSIQPRFTWVLDIDRPEEELRRGLSAGHRGSINAASRRGLRCRSTREPEAMSSFLEVQRAAASAGGYAGQPERYHRTLARVLMPLGAATLYIAEDGDGPVAAALSFDFGPARYYAHAVSDPVRGRRLGAAAPLVWQMVLDARADGRRVFDFWGVQPGAPEGHPWAGFTRFKMAFGGRLLERAGTWDLVTRPARYRAYAALRSLRR